MGTVFNKKELLVLLQDFHCLTGLRSAVFDSYGIEVLAYPPELPAFCSLIRSVPEGKTGCYLCDQAACRNATRQKKTIIYPCHAGLIEVITPIQIDDAVVGFLLLSHIVQGEDENVEWAYAQKCCAAYNLDTNALHEAYNTLQRTPYPVLKSAADLLALAAAALYQKGMTRLASDSMQEKLSQYLAAHLHENLTSETICRALSVSRTGLYYLSRQSYGCGINEQITHLRIQKAMKLLCDTSLSNTQICQQIGFPDDNYFYRVFRRQTGLTPRQYRDSIIADNTKPE